VQTDTVIRSPPNIGMAKKIAQIIAEIRMPPPWR
jgi:hypothetical protein